MHLGRTKHPVVNAELAIVAGHQLIAAIARATEPVVHVNNRVHFLREGELPDLDALVVELDGVTGFVPSHEDVFSRADEIAADVKIATAKGAADAALLHRRVHLRGEDDASRAGISAAVRLDFANRAVAEVEQLRPGLAGRRLDPQLKRHLARSTVAGAEG